MRWGVRSGTVDGQAVVGGELTLTVNAHLLFNPNFEISNDRGSLNADVAWGFELKKDAAGWLGGGAAIVTLRDQDLDVGVNVIGGIGVQQGRLYPYVQLKITKPSGSDQYTTAVFGIRF